MIPAVLCFSGHYGLRADCVWVGLGPGRGSEVAADHFLMGRNG
jgi:hypothetical protein